MRRFRLSREGMRRLLPFLGAVGGQWQSGQWGSVARRLQSTFDGADYAEFSADDRFSFYQNGTERVRLVMAAGSSILSNPSFGTAAGINFASGDSTVVAGAAQWTFLSNGTFYPNADGTRPFGIASARWGNGLFGGTVGYHNGTSFLASIQSTGLNVGIDNGLVMTNQTDGAAAGAGTITNAPSAGNPAFWLRVSINGNARFIPCWA